MDSLSQIVLGAATGEVVLGRKIGNRALAVGALAGTIPDLDVFAGPFLSEMQAMDFHRGISHSVLFTAVAPLLSAGLARWFYGREVHKNKTFRLALGILPLLGIFFLGGVAGYAAVTTQNYWALAAVSGIVLAIGIPIFRYIQKKPREIDVPSYLNWYWLFFWCFATHILLDVCTTYGTQVFMPFSNMRATFSMVSVVDLLYTIPLVLSCLLVSLMRRTSRARDITNWAGIIVSSLYLLFALFNKTLANDAVKNGLKAEGVAYARYLTSPAIFNSLLWSSTAETDSSYLVGAYSVMDPEREITHFHTLPKNHHLLAGHEQDEDVEILRRFSDGYYILREGEKPNSVEFMDMRWGVLDNFIRELKDGERFPMVFQLELIDGEYVVTSSGHAREGEEEGVFANFQRLPNILKEIQQEYPGFLQDYWDRIMGRWQ